MADIPSVLSIDTILYHPAEPKGRLFPAGSPSPGEAWSMERGGPKVGAATTAEAAKDLLKAQDTIDNLSGQIDGHARDIAQISAERDAANGKVSDLEQRAIAAETARTTAETSARDYMLERDSAREEVRSLTAKLATAEAERDSAQAEAEKVPGLMSQLETANQAIADLSAKPKPKAGKADDVLDPDKT